MKPPLSDRVDQFLNKAYRVLTLWLFGDVAFAVVPIATIAIITILLGDNFNSFLLIKEWSFATIVFFGVSIRKLIRLKVELQRTPTSFKLDSGVQLFVLLLIASVLVLSFVILSEKGVLARQQTRLLSVGQISLFAMGLWSILLSVVAEEKVHSEMADLPDGISKPWLFQQITCAFDDTGDSLEWAVYAIERVSTVEFAGGPNERVSSVERDKLYFALRGAFERLDNTASEGKKHLENFRTGKFTHRNGEP